MIFSEEHSYEFRIHHGREELERLFSIAIERLRDREIKMEYDAAAIDWLLGQPDWHVSLNGLLVLNGIWHRRVANVIEELLLEGKVQAGDSLRVLVNVPQAGSEFQFVIAKGGESK